MKLMNMLCCCHENSFHPSLETELVSQYSNNRNLHTKFHNNNICNYTITWGYNTLPCSLTMFFDCVLSEITNRTYNFVEITIRQYEIAITFDDNPFTRTTIHFTPT